jgi:hypothetical protein
LVEVQAYVDLVGAQHRAGSSSRHDGLQLLAAADAARHLVDRLAQRVAHGQFVDARPLDMAGDPKQPRAAVALRAQMPQ